MSEGSEGRRNHHWRHRRDDAHRGNHGEPGRPAPYRATGPDADASRREITIPGTPAFKPGLRPDKRRTFVIVAETHELTYVPVLWRRDGCRGCVLPGVRHARRRPGAHTRRRSDAARR